jgi:hypothetical protein
MKYVFAPAAIAAALVLGGAVAAQATTYGPIVDLPDTISPGGVGTVGAKIGNQIGVPQTGKVSLSLTAPAGSTFTSNQVTGTQIIQGVRQSSSSVVFNNCTLSAGNTKMSCTGTITIPAAGNGKASALDFRAPIAVSSSAASGTVYSDGDFNLSDSGDAVISGGRTNLQYQTPVVVDTPVINPMVGFGALGAAGVVGASLLLRRRRAASLFEG